MAITKRERLNILFRRKRQQRDVQQLPKKSRRESAIGVREIITENTSEYCHNSTLHGLKYIVDDHLYPAERIFFALSFLTVVVISGIFITNVYSKWQTKPVIVGLSPDPSYIVNEPFPAVTLCNLNQASKKKAQQFKEDSSEYAMLQMLCKNEFNMTIADTINWNKFEEFIVNISQPCEEMIVACNFGAVDYECDKIFRTLVTGEGLCCVFNMLDPNFMYNTRVSYLRNITYKDDAVPVDWNSETGYPKDLPEYFYPRTAVGTGETLGLSLTFDIDMEDYYCSSATSVGLKMALHSPAETPHVKEIGTLLPAGSEVRIRIRPDKNEADLKLKSIDREYRQCIFQGEANLTYFAHYNRRNCEMECQAKQLLRECKCIAYHMPVVDKKARICGIKDNGCVELLSQNNRNRSRAVIEECQHNCWASCFDLNFNSDFFSAPISHSGFEIANKFVQNVTSDYAEKNMAVVHFYFSDNMFRSTKQTEFIGMTDFLSSVGGLMGLFMGFSFISIAEFFYYAIFRPYHIIKRHERVRNVEPAPRRIKSRHKQFVIPPRNPVNHIQIPEYLARSKQLQVFPPSATYRQSSESYLRHYCGGQFDKVEENKPYPITNY